MGENTGDWGLAPMDGTIYMYIYTYTYMVAFALLYFFLCICAHVVIAICRPWPNKQSSNCGRGGKKKNLLKRPLFLSLYDDTFFFLWRSRSSKNAKLLLKRISPCCEWHQQVTILFQSPWKGVLYLSNEWKQILKKEWKLRELLCPWLRFTFDFLHLYVYFCWTYVYRLTSVLWCKKKKRDCNNKDLERYIFHPLSPTLSFKCLQTCRYLPFPSPRMQLYLNVRTSMIVDEHV